MGIFANEKGTGIKTRSFFKRFISMSKIQLTMDYKKYDLLLFKIEGISYSPKFTHNFFGDDVFSGMSFNLRRSNLRYGDFSGPPQRWPYLLFKGSIFTTPKEPPQRFFLNRHISRYLNFNSKAYFEISIPQHGKKKSIKKPMSKFINYFFCLKKISLILGV